MYQDLKRMYWWPSMKKEISDFVSKCMVCQKLSIENQKLSVLQHLEIFEWRWNGIIMDFAMVLPQTETGKDAIWVITYRLTKSAHFLPVKIDYSLDKLAQLYVQETVSYHGVPLSSLCWGSHIYL